MVAGESGDRLVGDGFQRGVIERKIRSQPGIFGERQHMAERRSLYNQIAETIGPNLQRYLTGDLPGLT